MINSHRERAAAEIAARKTHENAIKLHLSGGRVDRKNLWLAVGYFQSGGGASLERPCCEHIWAHLLRETGRTPTAESNSSCGGFRHC